MTIALLVSRKKLCAQTQRENFGFVSFRNDTFSKVVLREGWEWPRFEFKVRRNEDSFNAIT